MGETETTNGISSADTVEGEEEAVVGPGPAAPRARPKRPLQFEQPFLDAIPSANIVTCTVMWSPMLPYPLQISSSPEVLMFWKKKAVGIEFAKHFGSHIGPIEGIAVSIDGLFCCTISNDRSVKIYDVVNYDMMVMIRRPYVPGAIEWVYKQGEVKPKLAISDRDTPTVYIYDARSGSNNPLISKEVHLSPIKIMWYNHVFDAVISVDSEGIIE